jgi:glycosyltransferase involved in cell wall biosynthesis
VTNVSAVRVAAIDKSKEVYHVPVDVIIDQYSPRSWSEAAGLIVDSANNTSNPTVVVLQHEYGLDADHNGTDGCGHNYVDIAKTFRQAGLMVIACLHTVLDDPNDHQVGVMRDLAEYCDAMLVTADGAIEILSSPRYGLNPAKIKHIDHGIRISNASPDDRASVKEKYASEGQFIVTTLGMLSPGKGIEYGIRAYAKFLEESCTAQQRQHLTYLIAGQCHPDFREADGGAPYKAYRDGIRRLLDALALRWRETDGLGSLSFNDYDVIVLDKFLSESLLLELYTATNVMLLPYLDKAQISSGILADALGSGRVAIATKFVYAIELLNPKASAQEGLSVDPYARGVLVDAGEPSVDQMAEALDYLVFNEDERLAMEARAYERGHRMRWDNTAWELVQYIVLLAERRGRDIVRDVTFTREKPSSFAKMKGSLVDDK